MTEIEIKHLRTEYRFSDSSLKNFYLFLYIPIGLVILFFRLLLGLTIVFCGNILPDVSFTRNILAQLFRAFFGVVLHVENVTSKETNVKVFVSNSITPMDHFVAHLATDSLTPEKFNLPTQLLSSLGVKNFGTSLNVDQLKKSIGAFILNNGTVPVFLQPEHRSTNGRAVLKFDEWPFTFTDRVQPVCLQVRRPVFDIAITTISATYWSDLFWYLFSPWTVYNLRFLPLMERGDLTDAEFADKVRRKIATELKIEACSYTASDVNEWEKRFVQERRRARMVYSNTNALHNNNPELHQMARQVKEVLPTVPYNVIFKDLVRTKNVDVTISNILEGHIPYTAETVPERHSQTVPVSNTATPSTSATDNKDSASVAFQTFPKSAQERMDSFQERKQKLIALAKKRYIEKHGLQVPNL